MEFTDVTCFNYAKFRIAKLNAMELVPRSHQTDSAAKVWKLVVICFHFKENC